jgi:hypothetical protein
MTRYIHFVLIYTATAKHSRGGGWGGGSIPKTGTTMFRSFPSDHNELNKTNFPYNVYNIDSNKLYGTVDESAFDVIELHMGANGRYLPFCQL